MSEPAPIGRWRVAGVMLETRQGDRGHVPANDRILRVDTVIISFDDYLHAVHERRWSQEVEATVRRFFYRNEDAIWPRPHFQGARMLQQAEAVLRDAGIDAALRYVKGTKVSPEARARGHRSGMCAWCRASEILGRTPGYGDDVYVCLSCHLKTVTAAPLPFGGVNR